MMSQQRMRRLAPMAALAVTITAGTLAVRAQTTPV